MGSHAEDLLVSVRRFLHWGLCALMGALTWVLCGCQPKPHTVDAAQYDAFWLWGGVAPQPVLKQARTLYVLQGEIAPNPRQPAIRRLTAQGVSITSMPHADIWLVYRANTLHWSARERAQIIFQLTRWQQAGNRVLGVQIDFDAQTRHLDEYVQFLAQLRQELPANYQLSITGLLDWASNADVGAINQLKPIINEVVVQTYQGKSTIANYQAYLSRLARLEVPFKIGLVQNGQWDAPRQLSRLPNFKGYVVFLVNPSSASK
jgi:hypothetical protein